MGGWPRRSVPSNGQSRAERAKKGTHAVNVSNEHSADSPGSARRFDRMARFPARFRTVVTARSAFVTQPSKRGHLAKKSGQTPKRKCPSARRKAHRKTRAGIQNLAGARPARPAIPMRDPHRKRTPASQQHSQRHHRPEDGQCPDERDPGFRHVRDPRRRLRSSGMLSAPGLHNRISSYVGTPRGTRGSEVLASFTVSHEGRSTGHTVIRRATIGVPRLRSQYRLRHGMLV